jgi:hypothetical protein
MWVSCFYMFQCSVKVCSMNWNVARTTWCFL